jgi:hypothetical protein
MLMLQVAGEDEDDDDVEAWEDFVAPDNEDEDRGTEGRKRGSSADSQDSASKTNRNRAGTSTSTSISRKKKGAKSTPDVGEIRTEMLLENRRRDRETEKKVNENLFHDNLNCTLKCHVSYVLCLLKFAMIQVSIFSYFMISCTVLGNVIRLLKFALKQFSSFFFLFSLFPQLEEAATRQPDEREAWGSWLQTVVRNCPKEKFRQFQTETLALSQRYQPTDEGQRTSGQQCPAPPPAPPAMFPPQPATSQFPAQGQFQHPSQQFQGQPQPQFHYQQQQMQQPGYMRQPTFTQLLVGYYKEINCSN